MPNNKGDEFFLLEIECPICGKIFFATKLHAYKDRRPRHSKVCSWSCVLESERLKQAGIKPKRKGEKG